MLRLLVPLVLAVSATAFPSSALPSFTQSSVTAPTPFAGSCKGAPQAASLKGVHYFLPPSSGDSIVSYTVATKAWGSIPIAGTPVAKMLDGASFAAVPAALPGIDDFLVVSGGHSKSVEAYSIQKKAWQSLKGLSNGNKNACSLGCQGYWMMMTGDVVKDATEKPATRQVYRYNITSGEAYENNGEKSRGGATCGCADNRAFWAGGFSNSGLSSNVETWGVDPFHRSGEPEFGMSDSKRDVGGGACGGLFVVAGGNLKKGTTDAVDVFNASSATGGKYFASFKMGQALTSPRMACLQDRYVLLSGGVGSKGCSNQVLAFDTQMLPASGSVLAALPGALSAKAQVAVATDGGSNTMFFDGTNGDLFSL